MGDEADPDAAQLAAIRALLARPPELRGIAVADAVVEFGPSFVDTLRRLSGSPAEAHLPTSGQSVLAELARHAATLLSAWLTGERITSRADEGERRVRATKQLAAANPGDSVLARLAVDAILRLPAGHEERDEAFARDVLLRQLEHGRRPGGDVNDLLVASFYLLHHNVLTPAASARLIDKSFEVFDDPAAAPAAVRDLLHAAHNYCITRAGEELAAAGDQYTDWMGRAERVLAAASGERVGLGARLAAMRARHFDIAEDAQRAADAYAELVDAGDPQRREIQAQALSEATLRLQTGEHQRVVDRLVPLLPVLTDRYLTAVTEADIANAGFAHGRAVVLMVSALVHLNRDEEAICVLDRSKSLRLRYRVALRQHPSHARILELERAILALSRGGAAKTGGSASPRADAEDEVPLRARLLEQYRRVRPDLGEQLARDQSISAVSTALEPGEGAVIVAGLDDMTTVSLVTTAGGLLTAALTWWPWSRWETLLARKGGWLDFLAKRPGADGRTALERLVSTADRVLGKAILGLLDQAGDDVRKIAKISHRWLHLIPYWALPSLADSPVSVFSSADEFVRSRSRPPGGAGGGCLVVANPTGDLPCSPAETESVVRLLTPDSTVLGPGEGAPATVSAVAAGLANAALVHFSGHAFSDHADPDRSALLVSPSAEYAVDPFPGWVAAAGEWRPAAGGWQVADLPGGGRLAERERQETGQLERRMERGAAPTVHALYIFGRLRRLGELWSAGDIVASGQSTQCRFAFLSACESGVAGGESSYVDEYGGLPAALRLGGIDGVVCSLWQVDEGFTALYVDLFYARLAAGHTDPVAVARHVSRWLRQASKPEVLERLDQLADQVRQRSPRAAMELEAYRARIDEERADPPFADAWEWASFYAIGGGRVDLAWLVGRKGAADAHGSESGDGTRRRP
jgi:hypothetical protein